MFTTTLQSEMGLATVTVWPLSNGRSSEVLSGSRVVVLGTPNLDGIVAVLHNGEPIEVRQECLASWKRSKN
jgi:hypothetical protein